PRRLRDRARLIERRRRVRPARRHVAEAARPRADVAEDHERRRAARETLRAVRACERLADGMEVVLAEKRLDLAEGSEVELFGADPVRKAVGHEKTEDRMQKAEGR